MKRFILIEIHFVTMRIEKSRNLCQTAVHVMHFKNELFDLPPVALSDAPKDFIFGILYIDFQQIDALDTLFPDDIRKRSQLTSVLLGFQPRLHQLVQERFISRPAPVGGFLLVKQERFHEARASSGDVTLLEMTLAFG